MTVTAAMPIALTAANATTMTMTTGTTRTVAATLEKRAAALMVARCHKSNANGGNSVVFAPYSNRRAWTI
jgi:hypothetical protein